MAASHVASASQSGLAQTTRSCSVTPSGNDRLVLVAVFWLGAQTISAITYASADISGDEILSVDADSGARHLRVYEVVSPAASANTAAVTFSAATDADCGISASAYQDCGSVRGVATAFGADATPTVNIASSATDLVYSACTAGFQATALTVGAGQTSRVAIDNIAFSDLSFAVSDETGAGTTTASYATSPSTSSTWGIGAVSIQAVGAAGNPHYYYAQQ